MKRESASVVVRDDGVECHGSKSSLILTLNGRFLFVPGDKLQIKDAPDVRVTVIGVSVFSGHVNYDVTWWHGGELKRADFKDWEVEPVPVEKPCGFNGTHA